MNALTTIDPPAIVSCFTPSYQSAMTNVWAEVSLMEQLIQPAFQGAQRELERLTTIDLPGIVSYFTPSHQGAMTNVWSGVSLMEQQIQSAFQGAQRELERYEQYQDRWDGYFAEPFAANVLQDAANMLQFAEEFLLNKRLVPTLVTTGPASDGSVDVELQVGSRRLLLTLYSENDTLRVASFHGDDASEQVAPLGTEAVARWLSWLSL